MFVAEYYLDWRFCLVLKRDREYISGNCIYGYAKDKRAWQMVGLLDAIVSAASEANGIYFQPKEYIFICFTAEYLEIPPILCCSL